MDKDLENAIETISKFIENPEKRILLIRGFDNKAKLFAALVSVNKYFRKCVLMVNVMKEAPRFVNEATNKKILPNSVNSKEQYPIGNMKMAIYSYASTSSNIHVGNEETCTIIDPIQTVLDNKERYKNFIKDLEQIKSRKIILITTNEWSIKNWNIEELADEVFFYSVENDNPDLMMTLKENGAI